ncbi:MAG: dTDP-4-dehydrorhamnose 3,5-epimerase family protein [Candidatus Omnitrophota bacterium]
MEVGIDGVVIKKVKKFTDERGWLFEIFRHDEMAKDIYPVMSYLSMTHQNVVRGPHEHTYQTDYFCFLGTSSFKLFLWDNRKDSKTFRLKTTIVFAEDEPVIALVPPGVVHAYKNIGKAPGLVLNYPNQLFAGPGKKHQIDEIRHEENADERFVIDD